MIVTAMGSRLSYLADPVLQKQEVALAIAVLENLDDETLRKACIDAVRAAGKSFVLAQHIYDAAKPYVEHKRTMQRLEAKERVAETHRLEHRRERVSPERAAQIMREVFGGEDQ